jgi:predicted RNA polymerase sigma factor
MKYLMTYQAKSQVPPTPEQLAALGLFTVEMIKSGVVREAAEEFERAAALTQNERQRARLLERARVLSQSRA